MSIKDILAKAAKGEELSEDERAALASFDPTDVASGRVKDVQAKAAKEAAELSAKVEELQAKLDEKDSATLTETEKLKRDLARAQKAQEAAQAAADTAQKDAAKTARNYALESVLGGIQWVDDSARAAGRVLLERELAEVDLGDKAAVTPIIDAAKQSVLSRLVAADGVNGTGIRNNATGTAKKQEPEFRFEPGMFNGMRPEEARLKMNELWKKYGNAPSPDVTSGRVTHLNTGA